MKNVITWDPFSVLQAYARHIEQSERAIKKNNVYAPSAALNIENYIGFQFAGISCAMNASNLLAIETADRRMTPVLAKRAWLWCAALYQSKLMYVAVKNFQELQLVQAIAGTGYHLLLVSEGDCYFALLVQHMQSLPQLFQAHTPEIVHAFPLDFMQKSLGTVTDGVQNYCFIDKKFFRLSET